MSEAANSSANADNAPQGIAKTVPQVIDFGFSDYKVIV